MVSDAKEVRRKGQVRCFCGGKLGSGDGRQLVDCVRWWVRFRGSFCGCWCR